MNGEIWLAVPAYEGVYEASSFVRVRSLDREIVDSRGQRRHLRGRVLSPTDNAGTILLWRDGRSFTTTVADVCAVTFAALPVSA